jgi:hypothetical protein
MPNPFAKSRKIESPYAIYSDILRYGGTMTWHVLKTYKMPKSEAKDPYARWMVAVDVHSATYGAWDMGDTYRSEVERYGKLVAATPEWLEAYGNGVWLEYLPTPEEYLAERV